MSNTPVETVVVAGIIDSGPLRHRVGLALYRQLKELCTQYRYRTERISQCKTREIKFRYGGLLLVASILLLYYRRGRKAEMQALVELARQMKTSVVILYNDDEKTSQEVRQLFGRDEIYCEPVSTINSALDSFEVYLKRQSQLLSQTKKLERIRRRLYP